jgi:hypothetical protein
MGALSAAAVLTAVIVFVQAVGAQTTTSTTSTANDSYQTGSGRSYLLKLKQNTMSFQNYGHGESQLREYAEAHVGNYLLFLEAGRLYRLDSPEKIAELDRLYTPLHALSIEQQALSAQQQALAAKQQPLAVQQQALGREQAALGQQQRTMSGGGAAPSAAAAQNAIGHEQSSLGRVQSGIGEEQSSIGSIQGKIGREQGEIGRQQGAVAKTLSTYVEATIKECLKQHSCADVSSEAAQLKR